MPSLKTRLGNIELDNPIILASGHASHWGDFLLKADRFGAGAVFMLLSILAIDRDSQKQEMGYLSVRLEQALSALKNGRSGSRNTGRNLRGSSSEV